MKIPSPFRSDDADYLTVPALKNLCSELGISTEGNRIDLIERIEKFSDTDKKSLQNVLVGLDEIFKIGIKTCLISKIHLGMLATKSNIEDILKKEFGDSPNHYICGYKPSSELGLLRYKVIKDDSNVIIGIEFVYMIELLRAKSTYSVSGEQVFYPVHVYVDYQKYFIIGRAKSTSALFKISDGLTIEPNNTTSTEIILRWIMNDILKKLSLDVEEPHIQKNAFKKTIFNILDLYTKTPAIIQKEIEMATETNKAFVNKIFKQLNISENIDLFDDAIYDLQIFVEKYASITYEDINIFINDRLAYPVKFLAQDNEFTKIQESSSGIDEPLQRKKAFFDSKKAVYTDKKCDKLCLYHQSEPQKYYANKPFNVLIYLSKNDCIVKFTKFVREGDIQNVLSRIIQMYDIQN